jgi:hypothetical protein
MPLRNQLVKYRNFDRRFALYEIDKKTKQITAYDGNSTHIVPNRDELGASNEYFYKENSKGDMKENYRNFMSNVQHLNHVAGINLAEYGYSIKDYGLSLFYDYARCYNCERLDDFETPFVKNAKRAGLIYYEKCEGEMKHYDINSHYPFIMSDRRSMFPMCKPTYHTITEKYKSEKGSEFWQYGLYRAKVLNHDPRLFQINAKNVYTHLDLTWAEENGYTVELICDGQPNLARYAKRISGKSLFSGFVDTLFPHKRTINQQTGKTNPLVKEILTCLSGAIHERKKKFHTDKNGSHETANPLKGDVFIFERGGLDEVESKGDFVRGHARFAPFLTAYGRILTAKLVKPHKETVKRIHTDGFYTTTTDDIPTSTNLGELKFEPEKSGYTTITNLNKIHSI